MKIFLLGLIGLIIGTFVILFGGGGAAIYLAILTGLFGLNAATASSTSLVTALPSLIIGAIIAPRLAQILAKTKITRYMKPTIGFLLVLLGVKSLL